MFSKFTIKFLIVICLGLLPIGCSTLTKVIVPVEDSNYQRVDLATKNSKIISGYLFKPAGIGPHPAIVALHGCSGLMRKNGHMNSRDLDWGKRLAENGYVVLYPDSFQGRGFDETCTHPELRYLPKEVRPLDAIAALQWLQKQEYVKADHIGLMGWSNGGSTLLWTIEKNSKILPKDLRNDFKIAIAFYPGCFRADQAKSWSNRVPVEILMGALDNWTPPKYCESLVNKASQNPPMHIELYPDSYHDFDRPDSPIHQLHGLANLTEGGKSATVGTNEVARQKSIQKVLALLKSAL